MENLHLKIVEKKPDREKSGNVIGLFITALFFILPLLSLLAI